MKRYLADLHIHTALSPCAEEEMRPRAIIQAALAVGLDMIAVCDHNTAGNTRAVQEAAGKDLSVIAGIEITTAEEVHVLGLFPNADKACGAASAVLRTLPMNQAKRNGFGPQTLLDAEDREIGVERRMLSAASTLSLEDTARLIREWDGLVVASHVDRPSCSVPSQLGFFPESPRFDAIEISGIGVQEKRQEAFAFLGLPMISSSDGHFLSQIGEGCTRFDIEEASFDELSLAFGGAGGRRCRLA